MVTGVSESVGDGESIDKRTTSKPFPALGSVEELPKATNELETPDERNVDKRYDVVDPPALCERKDETRDDITDICFADDPCIGYDILGAGDPCTDLIQYYGAESECEGTLLVTEEQSAKAATMQTSGDVTARDDLQSEKALRANEDAVDSLDFMPYIENMCNGSNMFGTPEKVNTRNVRLSPGSGDGTNSSVAANSVSNGSVDSVSTVGQMFGDLASLPSLATLGKKMYLLDDGEESVNESISLGNLSLMSEGRKGDVVVSCASGEIDDSITKAGPSLDTIEVEEVVEVTFDEVSVEKDISDQATGTDDGKCSVQAFTSPDTKDSKTGESAEGKDTRRSILLQDLRVATETHGKYDIKCANIMAALADIHFESGEYDQALKMYKEASSVYSAKLGDAHVTTLDTRVHVGKSLDKLGRHDDAIRSYHHVLEVRKGVCGETNSSVADTLVLIAKSLCHKKDRAPQALKEFKRALKLYRSCLGDSHPKVSAAIDDIAAVYMQMGDYSRAAAILDEVVKLKAAIRGMYNTDVAQSLIALGQAQQASGDPKGSIKSLKKAYSIYLSIQGENSAKTISTLECIADSYQLNGDTEQAIIAHTGVLKGKKLSLGDSHPLLASSYLSLGQCFAKTGDLDKANKSLKRGLAICIFQDKNVQNVPLIADIMKEMGIVLQRKGRLKDAVKVQKQHVLVRRKMKSLPQVARALFDLGSAQYDLKQYPDALTSLTESIDSYKQSDDNFGLDFAETLLLTGFVLQTTECIDQARASISDALKIFCSYGLDGDHKLVVKASSALQELGHSCECKEES